MEEFCLTMPEPLTEGMFIKVALEHGIGEKLIIAFMNPDIY